MSVFLVELYKILVKNRKQDYRVFFLVKICIYRFMNRIFV